MVTRIKVRDPKRDVAVVDPADVHYYQTGSTLVGRRVFKPQFTARTMGSLIPRGVHWIKAGVAAFEPETHSAITSSAVNVAAQ